MAITQHLQELLKYIKDSESDLDRWVYSQYFKTEFESLCMTCNPSDLVGELTDIIQECKFPIKTIPENYVFYRARLGRKEVKGSVDDCDMSFIMPYYDKDIDRPPALLTEGGRFNRSGVSFLYLSTTIDTCVAEVHLQVGQECSVGKFRCVKPFEAINLSPKIHTPEIDIWREILLQPVYKEKKYKYGMTQLLTDAFINTGASGIFFHSTQSKGKNIVCFKDGYFKLEKYSERLLKAEKIQYQYSYVKDTVRQYANNPQRKYINSFNSDEDESREREVEYLQDWIEHLSKLKDDTFEN